MRIGIYGGSFNPPHIGHLTGAVRSVEQLQLDKLLIVPSGVPPHKAVPKGTPDGECRLEMARIAFRDVVNAEVSDIELRRAGESYTADTVREVKRMYPGAEMFLVVGTDMFLSLEEWYDAEWLLRNVTPAVTLRYNDALEKIADTVARLKEHGTQTKIVRNGAIEISSSDLRRAMTRRNGAEYVDDCVYWYIIERKLYGAKPEFDRLRRRAYSMLDTKRIPHVAGCEEEAVHLAKRWGVNEDDAREAAILHDITKRCELDEQLTLCAEYGVETDGLERQYASLLHSKTAAAIASCKFNVNNDVQNAILWHTTGRAAMSPLEKIIYLADYIEPTRDLDGVNTMRQLAYEDIDGALIRGISSVLEDLAVKGKVPHEAQLNALRYLVERVNQ